MRLGLISFDDSTKLSHEYHKQNIERNASLIVTLNIIQILLRLLYAKLHNAKRHKQCKVPPALYHPPSSFITLNHQLESSLLPAGGGYVAPSLSDGTP